VFSANRLPLLLSIGGASGETVKDNLFAAIAAESARLQSAVAVVDGSLVMSSTLPEYRSEAIYSVSFYSWCSGFGVFGLLFYIYLCLFYILLYVYLLLSCVLYSTLRVCFHHYDPLSWSLILYTALRCRTGFRRLNPRKCGCLCSRLFAAIARQSSGACKIFE
jgi:hypothetical protein